jgi:hypothetical protein
MPTSSIGQGMGGKQHELRQSNHHRREPQIEHGFSDGIGS